MPKRQGAAAFWRPTELLKQQGATERPSFFELSRGYIVSNCWMLGQAPPVGLLEASPLPAVSLARACLVQAVPLPSLCSLERSALGTYHTSEIPYTPF